MILTRGGRLAGLVFILSLSAFTMYASYKIEIGQESCKTDTSRNIRIGKTVSQNIVPTQATAKENPTKSSSPKVFIYLTQTEQCLPPNLARSSEIGDPKKCNCDVIVLSFRTKCQARKLPHITYQFYPSSTWGTGRNVLYFTAIARSPRYHYYIFLDEDVVLRFNSFAPPEMKRLPPFRVFEKWLLKYEPAVGVLDFRGHHGAIWTYSRRKKICKKTDKPLVIPTVWYDAIFNAFHYKSIEHVLPYRTQYESQSWWSQQYFMFSAVEVIFRGQALMFVPVTASNPKHRPYPRGTKNLKKHWKDYMDTIREEAPLIYRNRSLFKDLEKNWAGYVIKTRTYCMKVTRHQSIKPYSHFDRKTII